MGEGQGAGGTRARAGRAGPHRVSKSRDTHNHRSESNREPKSETRRDEHVIKHDITQKKYASA
jgi:hypothetical protein